jgi:hypothetical protein
VNDAESWAQQIRAHIEWYIGRIDNVFSGSGIDVLHVGPVESRTFHTLITVGMSSEPMQLPPDVDAPRRVELMMTLPERWRLGADTNDPAHWPTRLLQSLSRLPREKQTSVRWGDAVPNGEPPRPLAPDTSLCGVIIAPSLLVPVAFYELNIAGERVAFYSAIPLYREELELRQREGMEALLGRLLQKDINDVVEPRRRNVAKKRFGFFL